MLYELTLLIALTLVYLFIGFIGRCFVDRFSVMKYGMTTEGRRKHYIPGTDEYNQARSDDMFMAMMPLFWPLTPVIVLYRYLNSKLCLNKRITLAHDTFKDAIIYGGLRDKDGRFKKNKEQGPFRTGNFNE